MKIDYKMMREIEQTEWGKEYIDARRIANYFMKKTRSKKGKRNETINTNHNSTASNKLHICYGECY